MLTDGEFVMSKGAVQKFGVRQLEAMNAAGGGTNLPKMVDNTVYAGGGLIGLPGMGGGGGGTNAITSQAKARTIGSVLSDPFCLTLRRNNLTIHKIISLMKIIKTEEVVLDLHRKDTHLRRETKHQGSKISKKNILLETTVFSTRIFW